MTAESSSSLSAGGGGYIENGLMDGTQQYHRNKVLGWIPRPGPPLHVLSVSVLVPLSPWNSKLAISVTVGLDRFAP